MRNLGLLRRHANSYHRPWPRNIVAWILIHLSMLLSIASSGTLNGKTRLDPSVKSLSKDVVILPKRFGKEVLSVYAKVPVAVAVGKGNTANKKMYTDVPPRSNGFGAPRTAPHGGGTEDESVNEPTYPRGDLSRRDLASEARARPRKIRKGAPPDVEMQMHAEIDTAVGHGTAGGSHLADARNVTAEFVDPAEIE